MKHLLAAALAIVFLASAARAAETAIVQIVKAFAQAPFYIAEGNGYFAKEGIKVEAGNVR
jgi:ABC-type nitrate/sulfonate/bicarbonate transport system substrate-binding protein